MLKNGALAGFSKNAMNTDFKNTCRVFSGALYAVMVLLMATSGRGQNLFVSSDVQNGYVTEITQGVSTNVYATGFSLPTDLAFDNKGNLFVLNSGSGNIIEVTPSGTQIPFAAGLSNPVGMAMDNSNDLFVVDLGSSSIYEFTPNGTPITVASNSPVVGLALDSAGNLYAGDYENEDIIEFTNNGGIFSSNFIVFAHTQDLPQAMIFNRAGDLFSEYYNTTGDNGVDEFTPDGRHNTFSEFGPPWPVAMAFDNTGNLYVSDESEGTILKFTTGGVQSTYASGLIEPAGLAFEPVTTPPPLGYLSPAGDQSVLFWPTTNGNFVLQSATNLKNPNWTTVSNAVPVIAFTVTNAQPGQFFRLQQQ